MLSEPITWIGVAVLAVLAFAAIPALLRRIGRRRPDGSSADRDQAVAQIRAFTVRAAEGNEATWDGKVRGSAPTDEF
jgi:hypothetical protein